MFSTMMKMAEESAQQFAAMQHSQTQMLQSLMPSGMVVPGATHVALSPLSRLANFQNLVSRALTRQLLNCQGLWSLSFNADALGELQGDVLKMQAAIFERLSAQQAQWKAGLEDLETLAGGIKEVNTLSKLFEQESNLAARLGALVSSQATATMELMESVQIGYGYLLARQAQDTQD
ncbi:hypothetical protein J5J83_15890 [Azoarcus sp. L1K30]|uniref:hypothetical protein n=1 Tax=Azoarcus sp. L1K30 TaxID=2820277 RepID=UPI001B82DF67|nr:hypothetical protein [Azoarcus sp. L1K30]MBR0567605.1 hypothetical protein [Azoarcus sp. L1K30]